MFRILFTSLLFCFCIQHTAFAQSEEYGCPCSEDGCDDILSAFKIEGEEAVVCNGIQLSVSVTGEREDIDYFIWDWGDGEMDILTSPENATHEYSISEEETCEDDDSVYEICLTIVRECSGGYSCHNTRKPIKVIHSPRAFFDAAQTVCISEAVNFDNLSCNAESYLWDFGDGTTSTDENPSHTFPSPGNYTVRLTAINECNEHTFPQTITVVGAPESNFEYEAQPSGSFCKGVILDFEVTANQWTNTRWEITPFDTLDVCFTDTSMTTLTRNISTRMKTAGEYVFTLTGSNICTEESVTMETIIILERPSFNLVQPASSCESVSFRADDIINFDAIRGDTAGYEWTFTNANRSSSNDLDFGTVDFAQSGSIQLTILSECGDVTNIVQVVVATTSPIQFGGNPSQICQNEDPIQLNVSEGGIWESLSNNALSGGGLLNPSLLSPGMYTLTYSTGTPECENKSSIEIEILEGVSVELSSVGAACSSLSLDTRDIANYTGEITSYRWTQNGELLSEIQFPTLNFEPINAPLILEIEGACGTFRDTVAILVQADTEVIIQPVAAEICSGASPITLEVNVEGGRWIGEGITDEEAGIFDPGSVTPDNTYSIGYEFAEGACENVAEPIEIRILEGGDVELREVEAACNSLRLDTRDIVNYTGEITSYRWTQNGEVLSEEQFPMLNFGAVDAPLIIEIEGSCGPAVDTIDIFVQADTEILIQAIESPICAGSTPITLEVNIEGGRWIGDGIVDEELGIFDPASVVPDQSYSISYEFIEGPCENVAEPIEIEVVSSQLASIQDEIICTDSEVISLEVDVTGGTWTGEGVDETGVFDPSGLPSDTTYQVSYTFDDANGCTVSTAAEVLVESLPIQSYLDTIQLCLSDIMVDLPTLLNYTVLPEGGTTTWSGDGIVDASGSFNSATLTEGFYTLSMQYQRNDCTLTNEAVIEIIEAQPLQLPNDTIICISADTLRLTSNLTGGTWLGDGINETGLIDLSVGQGSGTFEYEYRYQTGTSCEQVGIVRVEIVDLGAIIDAGTDLEFCEGETSIRLANATPTGGIWEGTGVNPSTGEIDISQLQLDSVYVFSYEITSEAAASCKAIDSRSLIIHANPDAAFELEGTACIGVEFGLVNNSENAIRYAWSFGDGETSTEAEPRYEYNTEGNKQITLTAISDFGCEDVATQTLLVTTPPTAAYTLPLDEACAPYNLNITSNSTGFEITERWLVQGDTIEGNQLSAILDSITDDTYIHIELQVGNLCAWVTLPDSLLLHPYPLPDFGISQDEGCSPSEVDLIDNSLGNADNLSWMFGNGNTGTGTEPETQIYTTPPDSISVYTITLTASNECGTRSLSKEVEVYPPDIEAFIQQDTLRGCQPLAIEVESFATIGSHIAWQIIDPNGNVDEGNTGKILTDTLTEAGIYQLLLFASRCGTAVDTAIIEVLPAALVDFMPSRPYVCVGDTIQFQNLSEGISRSEWRFGDGSVSNDRSPIHRFDSAGVYWVELTAYSTLNDCPATQRLPINVLGIPSARFTPSTTMGCVPLEVDFENTGENIGELRYVWKFDHVEGLCATSSSFEQNPTHRFECPGQYTVTLEVYDQNECFADTSVLNVFAHALPESNFAVQQERFCLGYDEIQLQNLSSDDVEQFEWHILADTLREENPIYTPTQAGMLDIRLLVRNRNNCTATYSQSLEILPSPVASFVTATEGCEDFRVQFENTSEAAETTRWTFADGNRSLERNPTHLFTEAGDYAVQLVVTNSNGCPNDSSQVNILVHPKPAAAFEFEKASVCGTPNEVRFENQSNLNVANYWHFGDGGSDNITDPTHPYNAAGDFEARLIVETEFGCLDTAVQFIPIFEQPVADVEISEIEGCEDLEVTLRDFSADNRSRIFQLGDLPFSEEANFQILLTEPGAYDLQLIAIYNEFCQDTLWLSDAIRVYESPIADFSYVADRDPNVIGDVQFSNESINSTAWQWDFGDGTTSFAENPAQVYSINRALEVQLIALQDNGGAFLCSDTIVKPVDPEWIKTFYAPTALAPDYGQLATQVFKPVGIGLAEYEISVYSPWGNLVWYSTDLEDASPAACWNGRKYNEGEILAQGAYVWRAWMRFEDGSERIAKGTVTLLR